VRYADALRRCVTAVRYGALRYVTVPYGVLRCVTLMRYGVSRWRVMPMCYGALRRCVTVRYFDALRCVTLVCYNTTLRQWITTIATKAYKRCRTIFRFYSKARSTTYYAFISYVHSYAYCYQLCITHVNHLTQLFHILLLLTPNS